MTIPEHLCVDCRALPLAEQPSKPRPAPFGGLRSRRCDTHKRAFKARQRITSHTARGQRTYGLSAEDQAALWALQGWRCPCGRQPTRQPDHDHCHDLAREHDHPDDQACRLCMRGYACRACNTYVLGRYTAAQLRALADYLDDPPMTRLRQMQEEIT